jgi:hypothetical protein
VQPLKRRIQSLERQERKVPVGETTLAEFRWLLHGPFTEQELRASARKACGDSQSSPWSRAPRIAAGSGEALPWFFPSRILLAHPEKGLTGVLLIETGKPVTPVPATPEDEEWVRGSLKRHREHSRETCRYCELTQQFCA